MAIVEGDSSPPVRGSAQQPRVLAEITATGGKVPSPADYLEGGVNSPRPASPIDDAPGLFPRIIALRTYERMMRNDAQVRSSMRACKIPVMSGEWFVEAASDDQTDVDVAEFVDYNLLGNVMSVPWNMVMQDILRMMEFGSSVFELVWDQFEWAPKGANRNTRNFTMIRKLGYRPPSTIVRFLYDQNGGPRGVEHRAIDPSDPFKGKQVVIGLPIDKLLIFTYDQLGGNLEGQSLLRTAYKHWYYKEQLYKIDAIQKERHALGIPDIGLPPGYTQADLELAAELGANVRTNERAYILRPPGWEIGFAKPEGQLVNVLESAQHHDMMIARNVLVQFINIGAGSSSGSGQSGSRASSSTMYDLFLKSLRSVANMIADVINVHLIPQLVDYNFNVKRYPTLKVRRVGADRDLQMFSAAMRNLVDAGIISVDKETEKWVRREVDMPEHVDYADVRINQSLEKPFVQVDQYGKPIAAAAKPGSPAGTQVTPGRPPTGNQGKSPSSAK